MTHETEAQETEEYIKRFEAAGMLDPSCPGCREAYQSLREGRGLPFAPRHRASAGCESGRRAHCTCDACF